ncbi:MAG: aspartate-semialdehyde dehydrogenase [Candidatus Eisenbacteria bacterium]|nr:aspartate-semialdehyde dehydrogenase [Candidatus Eisenbacteria bacterium]
MRKWNVGVVGVTGAVGRTMLACLREVDMPIGSLLGFASSRSAGSYLPEGGPWGEGIEVNLPTERALAGLDLVLLSAGAAVSAEIVPMVTAMDAWAVDNSSAFRLDPGVPLIVPEVNGRRIPDRRGPIANPNCSVIQMVVAVSPLAARFGLRRVHVATYQSVSGRGQKGVTALRAERGGAQPDAGVFPDRIDGNVIPQCDSFVGEGFTREEQKMVLETRKILELPELPVHPTCVRVPVEVGHSEAVHLELEEPASVEQVRATLAGLPGVKLLDDPSAEIYPTARAAAGTNEVWVGRIRVDRSDPRILQLWVVADNLRKGAAWNAVQIACLLHARETGHACLPLAARV